MMINPAARRKLLSCLRILTSGMVAIAILCTSVVVVRPQGPGSDLKGKSRDVIVVPNGTVNAGEVKFKSDRDHDGMSDDDETQNGTNPDDPTDADTDSDGDGLSNGDEVAGGSNVNNADSDGDGVSDGQEVGLGFNPLDPSSQPPLPATPGTYQVTRSEGAAVVPGDTNTGNFADDDTTIIPLPFDYTLYNQTFSEASISSNGVLQFIDSFADSENTCLPYQFFSYTILPLWDNLRTDAVGGGVFTSISGAAPNRIFNIEWRAELSAGGETHFEVRLYEGQTRFDVIYGNVTGAGNGATIGVQRETGLDFTQYSCDGTNAVGNGTQLSFTLVPGAFPTPTPLVITPNPVNISINSLLGQQPVQLRVTRANTDGLISDLTRAPGTGYQSADQNVAIVDDFGQVAGVANGSTSVTARNGASTGETQVNVSTFTPARRASISIPGYANAVEVKDNFAFVAAGEAGLQVVDISNRAAPFIAGALDTPGNANDVKVVGNKAYLADGPAGLHIIDVSSPSTPVLLGTVDTPGNAQGAAIAGAKAYVADGETAGLEIIDVTDPSTATIIGSLPLDGISRAVDMSGNLAVVARDFGLTIVDVTDPTTPQVLGTLDGYYQNLKVRDRFAYVAAYGSLDVVDFSNPQSPLLIASANQSRASAVALFEQFALTANINFITNPVSVFDCNDPSSPSYRGVIESSTSGAFFYGTGITIDSQYFYWIGVANSNFSFGAGGQTGNSRLFIGAYQAQPTAQTDTGGNAPTISLDSPQNGQTVFEGGPLTISANATDDVQVAGVRFSVNGQLVITDVAAPYQFNYRIPLGPTSLTIGATAVDLAGNQTAGTPITVTVLADPPPSVTITSPPDGTTVFEGQTIEIAADASDNVQVTQVAFTVNGEDWGTYFNPPYSFFYTVPEGISSLNIVARATDNLGRSSSAERITPVVPGPKTTVTGRVFDTPGQPAAGLTATVFSQFTSQTGTDGIFTITDVPTVRGNISVSISGDLNGRSISFTTDSKAPVPDGTTDFGAIILTNVTTTTLGETPSALGLANFIGDSAEDLFFAFSNQPAQIYQSDTQYNLVPDANMILPFQSVVSGGTLQRASRSDLGHRSIIVQLPGQSGNVTSVRINSSGMLPPVQLATGLIGDSDFVAVANDGITSDHVGNFRPVLSFLKVTGGTTLTVRFGDDQDGFSAPVELPVDPAASLRSPTLADIDGDGRVDLLVVKQLAGTEGRLIVYPRISTTAFGPPVESPITLRSSNPTSATIDYAVGNLLADPCCDRNPEVAVLGDDRIRVYRQDGAGNLTLDKEVLLPVGSVPLGIAAGSQLSDDFYDDLVVSLGSTVASQSRSLFVYMLGRDDGARPPQQYQHAGSAALSETRIIVGHVNDRSFEFSKDIVLVEGETLTVFWDIGRRTFVD